MRQPVLVVDDEVGMRSLLMRWLTAAGYSVHESASAELALEKLAASPDIKVLILDLQMPGQGGAWLINQLRSSHPAVSVILATSEASVPGTLSLQPSVVGYLVKPLQSADLISLVAEGVRRSDQYVEQARRGPGADPVEGFLDRKLTRGEDPAE